jgi:hypothetical protein
MPHTSRAVWQASRARLRPSYPLVQRRLNKSHCVKNYNTRSIRSAGPVLDEMTSHHLHSVSGLFANLNVSLLGT